MTEQPSAPAGRGGCSVPTVWIVILMFLALILVSQCSLAVDRLVESASVQSSKQLGSRPAPPSAVQPLRASLRQMVLEHARNGFDAEQRYDGRLVAVSGLIDEVAVQGGAPVVWLNAGPGTRMNARLEISEGHQQRIRNIRTGQVATFYCPGVSDWTLNVPAFENCAIDLSSVRLP
jgi:hypothetical protein